MLLLNTVIWKQKLKLLFKIILGLFGEYEAYWTCALGCARRWRRALSGGWLKFWLAVHRVRAKRYDRACRSPKGANPDTCCLLAFNPPLMSHPYPQYVSLWRHVNKWLSIGASVELNAFCMNWLYVYSYPCSTYAWIYVNNKT